MSVNRVMGTEVEYGISVKGHPDANPMLASSQVVNAYGDVMDSARRARWDFEEESPLRDARGFDLSRRSADHSLLTDEEVGLANLILTNGARLYVDHAHPEYSSPEVTSPRAAVTWDRAGELVMTRAAQVLAACVQRVPNVYFMEEFGAPEAIWEFQVASFPAVVTIDAHGHSLHQEVLAASQAALAKYL